MPEIEWELWYQDTFDPETPRRVQAAGTGLEGGLVQLWSYHLRETVGAKGERGFARFNLWYKSEGRSIEIIGPWQGAVLLRGWAWGGQDGVVTGDAQPRAGKLLSEVAHVHAQLVWANNDSAMILAAAAEARDRHDFEAWLRRSEISALHKMGSDAL